METIVAKTTCGLEATVLSVTPSVFFQAELPNGFVCDGCTLYQTNGRFSAIPTETNQHRECFDENAPVALRPIRVKRKS